MSLDSQATKRENQRASTSEGHGGASKSGTGPGNTDVTTAVGALRFEAVQKPPSYVPARLAMASPSKEDIIELPVVVQWEDKTFRITTKYEEQATTKSFWMRAYKLPLTNDAPKL